MVANTLLALSALLLLAGARARRCEGEPEITAAGPTVRKCLTDYCAAYGETVEIFCTYNDTENLTIQLTNNITNNEEYLPTEVVNATTVVSLLKPTLGNYTYICRDSKSGCTGSLIMNHEHALAVQVSSPRVQFKKVHDMDAYFVPHGDSFQIICAGREYQTLHIYEDDKEVGTVKVNDTSVAYSARAAHTSFSIYECRAQDKAYQHFQLIIDYIPEAFNFSCFSFEYGSIECSWNTSIKQPAFKLYYIGLDDALLVCLGQATKGTATCVWGKYSDTENKFRYDDENVSMITQTCNGFICNNQTFTFNYCSIAKQMGTPITKLNVECARTGNALLSWQSEQCSADIPCSYKVEYRLLDSEAWRQADTSSVQCGGGYHCQFCLCPLEPGSTYEVRVYTRYKLATDDRLWSDPVSVSVVTKPIDECSSCKAAHDEPCFKVRPYQEYTTMRPVV